MTVHTQLKKPLGTAAAAAIYAAASAYAAVHAAFAAYAAYAAAAAVAAAVGAAVFCCGVADASPVGDARQGRRR